MRPHLCLLSMFVSSILSAAVSGSEPFDYFQNSWSVIGLRDYQDGTRITPDNALLLGAKARLSISFGRKLEPLSRKQTKTLQQGRLPIVQLGADDDDVHYAFTLWATPLPDVPDVTAAFDAPTFGENYLNWIRVRMTNLGSTPVQAKLKFEFTPVGNTSITPFDTALAPGATSEYVARVPFLPLADARRFDDQDADAWLKRTADYWQNLLDRAAKIEVPEEKSVQALRAAHVCQLIAADHGELHAGEGFYDEFYIRDGGYQIMELEEAGLWDAVRIALKSYLKSQRPDGRFETQKNQFDANGQAVWVLWQYAKITGDREWLSQVYPQMRRAADWTIRARHEAPIDSPFAGLLPAAFADGECLYDGKHHIVGYDLWNLRGLLCTADAARTLGRGDEAQELTQEADDYRRAIDAATRRTGKDLFPPSWEGDGTFWGNTETLWPTELFAAGDPRVTGTIASARRTLGGGFAEGTIRWLGTKRPAIHPYMSAYTTMASLTREEHDQVVEDFYWYLLHSTATHAFPEGIYYPQRFAWNDTIPHATGASNYALLLRHMLVHERGNELHLLAGVPDEWLADGKDIRVERLPTHFGEISLHVHGQANGITLELTAPAARPPHRTILHVPRSRPLLTAIEGLTVQTRADQNRHWDFPTVVALYERSAPPIGASVPHE